MKQLPADPKPFGFPTDQIIEGGIQARITKPGLDKITQSIPTLLGSALGNGFCALEDSKPINLPFLGTELSICDQASAACSGNKGCSAYVYLNTTDLPAGPRVPTNVMPPAPGGRTQDNKLGIKLSVNDSPPAPDPIVRVDINLDVLVPLRIAGRIAFIDLGSCTMYVHTAHVASNNNDPLNILADIRIKIDPATGGLSLDIPFLDVMNIGSINIDSNGGVCSLGEYLDDILDIIDNLPGFIRTFLINNVIRPIIEPFVLGLLPPPDQLGIKGTLNSGDLLASLKPPKDTNLEMFVIAGGYVQSKAGGLTVGVMSGLNSDRDQTTRAPGLTSEPSLCVPTRPTPELGGAPWNLPPNAARKTFTLLPAPEFAGNPDPLDPVSNSLRDVAIGVSRTFLDLAGFHIYNSGTLCLHVGGEAIPQLNAGTLSVVIGSLTNIIEDRKAPLALVVRPQTPLTFTIGTGTMTDPLLNVAVADMRVDFYGWMEERWVRLLTMGLDLNLGVNLTVTKNAMGQPGLQPELLGLDAKNVTIRVLNTDLLAEDPKALEAVFPTLINVVTGALGGAIAPFPLPELPGFSLDDLTIGRVQTTQDDFLGVFGTIKVGSPAPLIDWSNPNQPVPVGELRTRAVVAGLDVPPPSELRGMKARPKVTISAEADGARGQPVEYAYRVNGGWWHPWTRNGTLVIEDDAFILQGRHQVEVRSRVAGQWSTEDATPAKLDVLIDSMPPEIHESLGEGGRLELGGFDIVSPAAALEYAWLEEGGQPSSWSKQAFIDAATAQRLSGGGQRAFTALVRDEAGNVARKVIDWGALNGFHGRTTNPPASGGCDCAVGSGRATEWPLVVLVAAGLLGLALRRRLRLRGALVGLGVLGLAAAATGCGCENTGLACKVDDDCAKMQCAAGQLPQCSSNECTCAPDIAFGDVGRFSSMTLIGPAAYVAAYNNQYGDLMIGSVNPPGVVSNWEFVDGVPLEGPAILGSHVRGGVESKGDDVGRYTSIEVNQANEPIIAYYDKTNHRLKLAHFGVIRWRNHVVDKGNPGPEGMSDDIGRWANLTVGPDGKPAIAYTATIQSNMNQKREGQLRWAQAKTAFPIAEADWEVTVLDARELPDDMVPDGGMAAEPLLPEGIGLMPSVARRKDGRAVIAYYDRTRGNLRYVEQLPGNVWSTPAILDGEDDMGGDTADVGLYPAVAVDEQDEVHISYVDATHDNLLYVNLATRTPEVVDDGYRPGSEMTLDGLDSPVWHLVGDSSSIKTVSGQVVIAYQDSTALQLRLAQRGQDGRWMHNPIAGHAMPFKGSYGFYAQMRVANRKGVISSYAINQHVEPPLFYVEVFSIDLGLIM